VRGHSFCEDELVLTVGPINDHAHDLTVRDEKFNEVTTLALNAVIHHLPPASSMGRHIPMGTTENQEGRLAKFSAPQTARSSAYTLDIGTF
jgi:hypothetical protein